MFVGIEIDKPISADFKTLCVRRKIRRAKLGNFLKTDAGRREVDLCAVLAAMLREFVEECTSGFLSQPSREIPLTDESPEARITPRS
jgi:hypothetical protein